MSRDLERTIPREDARNEALEAPRQLDVNALRSCDSLDALSDLLKGNSRNLSREGVDVARQEIISQQLKAEREKSSITLDKDKDKAPNRREVEIDRDRDRDITRTREILERQRDLDTRLQTAIDKTSDLYNRNNELIRNINDKRDGMPLSVKDQDRVSQINYVNSSLSEILSDTLKERQESLKDAWNNCNFELAKESFAREIDGKEITADERANLELASYLTKAARELPDKDASLASFADEKKEKASGQLTVPEIPLSGKDFDTHYIRDEVLKKYGDKGLSEDKINELKREYRADYNAKLEELRNEYKADYKMFERIREGEFKCDNPRYLEYAEKRNEIENKWVSDFQSLSGEYREILDSRQEALRDTQDKFDQGLVKAFELMRQNDIKLDKDEKAYINANEILRDMSKVLDERNHQFYGMAPERETPERTVSKAAQQELDSILKDASRMHREQDTHLVFARLDRFLNKTVPYDSVKDEALDNVRNNTNIGAREVPSLNETALQRSADDPLSPLNVRQEAERAYNGVVKVMDDHGFLTSSELFKVCTTKMIFDDEAKGLSNELKAERPMAELKSLSRSFSTSVDRDEARHERLDNIKNFVSRSFEFDRIRSAMPERTERKIKERNEDARDEERTKSLKSFLKEKVSDLRERASEKWNSGTQRFSSTVNEIKEDGWKSWLAGQLRDVADRLNQSDDSYVGEHFA